MIEISPLMFENQVKKSLSCVASPHLMRLGRGQYNLNLFILISLKNIVEPDGNRHVKDHITCNFYGMHLYLIHVVDYIDICEH